jgi:hypothetical protein
MHDMAEQIRQWISDVLSDDGTTAQMKRLTAALEALPLYGDPNGVVAIRPDGTIVTNVPGEYVCANEPTPKRWKAIALRAGARKYPALVLFLPTRPTGVPDCARCSGRGVLGPEQGVICGSCCGLGWINGSFSDVAVLSCVDREGPAGDAVVMLLRRVAYNMLALFRSVAQSAGLRGRRPGAKKADPTFARAPAQRRRRSCASPTAGRLTTISKVLS